jgi:Fur family transcriptional regulator, ferric uptake regulator
VPDEIEAYIPSGWVGRAETELRRAGYHSTLPRSTITEAIGSKHCAITADELSQDLRRGGRPIGNATIYRTLELFERLRLLRRLDFGDGVARYEPTLPEGGHHHHHYVCSSCGTVTAFEDEAVEETIEELSERFGQRVEEHELILRGTCSACASN